MQRQQRVKTSDRLGVTKEKKREKKKNMLFMCRDMEHTSLASKYSSHNDLHGTGSKNVKSYGVVTLRDPDKVSPRSCLCLFCFPA